jgi:hypothetical protein
MKIPPRYTFRIFESDMHATTDAVIEARVAYLNSIPAPLAAWTELGEAHYLRRELHDRAYAARSSAPSETPDESTAGGTTP